MTSTSKITEDGLGGKRVKPKNAFICLCQVT